MTKHIDIANYYGILGISYPATIDEIKKAWRISARKFHPDINKSSGAKNTFQKIQEAYSVLGNKTAKEDYDNQCKKAYEERESILKAKKEAEFKKTDGNQKQKKRRTSKGKNIKKTKTKQNYLYYLLFIVYIIVFSSENKNYHHNQPENNESKIKQLTDLSNKGDPQAQLILGEMYVNGDYVSIDYDKEIDLFQKSTSK